MSTLAEVPHHVLTCFFVLLPGPTDLTGFARKAMQGPSEQPCRLTWTTCDMCVHTTKCRLLMNTLPHLNWTSSSKGSFMNQKSTLVKLFGLIYNADLCSEGTQFDSHCKSTCSPHTHCGEALMWQWFAQVRSWRVRLTYTLFATAGMSTRSAGTTATESVDRRTLRSWLSHRTERWMCVVSSFRLGPGCIGWGGQLRCTSSCFWPVSCNKSIGLETWSHNYNCNHVDSFIPI